MSLTVRTVPPALLLVLLLMDTGYAFVQYYHQPLDGDMAWNLVPAAEVEPILADPLGWRALTDGVTYPNPNRFFSHWGYRTYLLGVPALLRSFTSPTGAVYLAAALAKLAVHLLLVGLLVRTVVGPGRVRTRDGLLTACLIVPFLQSGYFRSHIGIVDAATTYVFFYALPAALLLAYALPFVDRFVHGRRQRPPRWRLYLAVPAAAVVCLSGPLNPGVVLVATLVAGLAGLAGFFRWRDLTPPYRYLLLPLVLWSVYSLYLGRYNSLTIHNSLSLAEVYARLPVGFFRQFTGKLAFPVLFAALGVNYLLLRRGGGDRDRNPARLYPWVAAFALVYLLLLPLGGYRDYRATILRYDTILPVTLALVALYAAGARALLRVGGRKGYVLLVVGVVTVVFTNADQFDRAAYDCERAALTELVASPLDTVPLPYDCAPLLWQPYPTPGQSELPGRLLHRWRITETPKHYYRPAE